MDSADHQHIVGIATVSGCAELVYEGSEETLELHGGMAFDYCPLCGSKIKEGDDEPLL
jgi:hypothetical protein